MVCRIWSVEGRGDTSLRDVVWVNLTILVILG